MNESLDLTKILKNCPKGIEFYSTIYGDVTFIEICADEYYPIKLMFITQFGKSTTNVTKDGRYDCIYNGECTLFPSKDQRDWSKFTAPWYKKEKFDPKTLKPFDKVITRIDKQGLWCCELFSFIEKNTNLIKGCGAYYKYCIPYNDETKYLVGTTNEVPEYYRYWEK